MNVHGVSLVVFSLSAALRLSQDAASVRLLPAPLHTDRYDSLQCTDHVPAPPAEAEPDVHGDQHQHGPRVQAEGLREACPLPEGYQPAQAGQMGHQHVGGFPAAGEFSSLKHSDVTGNVGKRWKICFPPQAQCSPACVISYTPEACRNLVLGYFLPFPVSSFFFRETLFLSHLYT